MQSLQCPHRTQKLCLKLSFLFGYFSLSFYSHTNRRVLTSCKSEPEHGWRCLLAHKYQCESKCSTISNAKVNIEEWAECFTFVICFCWSFLTGLSLGSLKYLNFKFISWIYLGFLKKKLWKSYKGKRLVNACETELMTWSVKTFLWPTFYRSRKRLPSLKVQ